MRISDGSSDVCSSDLLAGAVAGLAGARFVAQFGFASPSLIGFALSAEALIWVALGGRGELISAALGVVTIRLLESQLSSRLENWWPLVLGLVFMMVVVLLPRGVFGELVHRSEEHTSELHALMRNSYAVC